MSTKIKLFFTDSVNRKLEEKLPTLGKITRLVCRVRFKTYTGWTKTYDALVDTGAHTSIIPLSIWQDIKTDILIDHEIHGIVRKKECSIPVKFANIELKIHDLEGNFTNTLKVHVYLSLMENVPLLIGFRDLLTKFKVYFDYTENIAHIECQQQGTHYSNHFIESVYNSLRR